MKRMVLMSYTPRALDEAKYHAFIRAIDYPNFRECPWIVDYKCWRIVASVQGKETFTHYDLMEVRDFADWPKIAEWPSVKENIALWTRDWSKHGSDHPNPEENLTISFCEDYWG